MKIFNKTYDPVKSTVLSEYNSLRSKDQITHLCHAPFRSLRFSQSGNVLACCFNRGYTLGKYPEDSIHDIWFGDNITKLRTYISKNDLSLGCGECARRLDRRLFNLSGAFQYDYLSQHKSGRYPSMFDFEISNSCNLECVMCIGENSSSIRKNREKLPLYKQHYDNQFIEQLKEFIPYLKEARFSGGEPFLVPLYYDIWQQLISLNPSAEISVLTNATVLNEEIKGLLAKGDFQISVSIDSLEKETYERIRLNANFTNVIDNIEYFYNYSLQKRNVFSLNVCAMKHNWAEIPSIVRYCNERNIHFVLHTVNFPPVESLWVMSSAALKRILLKLKGEKIIIKNDTGQGNLSTYNQFISQLDGWIENAIIRETLKKELSLKNEKELLRYLDQRLSQFSHDCASNIFAILQNAGTSENERINIMLNLIGFPPDLIFSEWLHNEPEKFLIRLKMFKY